jgi:5S rRNA maturation endonuclease (ribonuclease M5)
MERIVVCESFTAVWHLMTLGFWGVVSVMGSSWSREQADLIAKIVAPNGLVTILTDGDDAGERCAVTADGFGRFYRPLEERQKQLEEEIPRLQADIDVLKINQVSSEAIMAEAKDLYGRWPQLSREEKQRIVESITEKIVIGKGEVSISLCYLPSSEEMTKGQRAMLDSWPRQA